MTDDERAPTWRDSLGLYDAYSGSYDAAFAGKSHRSAYDALSGEYIARLLPPAPAAIVDAGCGSGRWAEVWLRLGHRVIGIEPSNGMRAAIAQRQLGPNFTLHETRMEAAPIAPGSADLVVAMGSPQYLPRPNEMLRQFASWVKPGGAVCVHTDSLMGLVLELVRKDKRDEALARLETRRGVFSFGGEQAELWLYDSTTLRSDFVAAGLVNIDCRGLMISGSAWGRESCAKAVNEDEASILTLERRLAAFPVMADAGLHLIASGRRPR